MEFRTFNPADGRPLAAYPVHDSAATESRLAAAAAAQADWARRPLAARLEPLRRLATLLRGRADEHARQMALEMGKPLEQGLAESGKCAWVCEHLAAIAPGELAERRVATEAAHSFVCLRPLGLVLAVMPWNFPFWQVVRAAAPALTVGNGVILKHAPATFGCAQVLEDLFAEAGYPRGLFCQLRLPEERVAELIADPRIAAVTLTGSSRAGRAVAAAAGSALKKCVLELGGSDPFVVLADADPELAAREAVISRMINNGQSCIAAKRFIVVENLHRPFVEAVRAAMAEYTCGDPLAAGTRLGPLARQDLRDSLHDQVQASLGAGARLLLGGQVPDRPGAWYPATVLDGVRPGMPAFDEELFGPVAAIVPATDEAEALALANRTVYGLGACVFTADAARGEHLAREELAAGSAFVNAFVRSDPRLPFGGIKESGYGRELSAWGLFEFANIKTVYIA
jgi:succinate-semialdehyde dehydrogenase / glutarate-semialdehyde dehydrogenase